MSARFEFVLHNDKSCVWSRSRDKSTYISHDFDSLTLSFTAFALPPPLSHFSALFSERPELQTTRDSLVDTQQKKKTTHTHKRTYSNRKHVSPNEISTFTNFQYTKISFDVDVASHTQIHPFSQRVDTYFVAMYILVSHVHTHIYTYINRNSPPFHSF